MTTDHQCLKETPTEIGTHLDRQTKEASVRCSMRPRAELKSGSKAKTVSVFTDVYKHP